MEDIFSACNLISEFTKANPLYVAPVHNYREAQGCISLFNEHRALEKQRRLERAAAAKARVDAAKVEVEARVEAASKDTPKADVETKTKSKKKGKKVRYFVPFPSRSSVSDSFCRSLGCKAHQDTDHHPRLRRGENRGLPECVRVASAACYV